MTRDQSRLGALAIAAAIHADDRGPLPAQVTEDNRQLAHYYLLKTTVGQDGRSYR